MRIIWNSTESRFEAVFQDFQADLDAAKAAGMKTTGPPDWKWYTEKVKPLDKLRKKRPASGLTILEDALAEYTRLKTEDDKKAALLAELKAAKKQTSQDKEDKNFVFCEEGFRCWDIRVEPTVRVDYVAPVWTGPHCRVCNDPVYDYEDQEAKICIWCEIVLDNAPEIC